MKSLRRAFLTLTLLATPVFAEPAAVIAKARAYLGGDAALNALKSVHYLGQLESTITTADGESQTTRAEIEIIFAKPFYQRIAITQPEKDEVTALDSYEAWQRISNPADATQWRLTLLDPTQIRRLRANTWENLSFFAGIEKQGGKVIDHGLVTRDGQEFHHLTFDHGYGILFHRFFDPSTGRLVVSETDGGAVITEAGENIVEGIRFPGSVTTQSTRPDGSSTTVSVEFTQVIVNETFPASLFRVPSVAASND